MYAARAVDSCYSALYHVKTIDSTLKESKWCCRFAEQHALVSFEGKLYAVGGYDQSSAALCQVETFDPMMNEWKEIKSMSKARGAVACVAANGGIYAFGGGTDLAWYPIRTILTRTPQIHARVHTCAHKNGVSNFCAALSNILTAILHKHFRKMTAAIHPVTT